MRTDFTIDGQAFACFHFHDYRAAKAEGYAPADGYISVCAIGTDRGLTDIPYTYSLVCAGGHFVLYPPKVATAAEVKAAKACLRHDQDVVSLRVENGGMENA